ncbi:putative cytosolic iron-sulfur protein assembly protein 1 [Cladobotryum mycophilum]|uniref:Probable cytosolic iron-sulfur protein assembly protein 1 n=1 Tax=Cladobotryum mycophilum TaxID=491253 RepID=A0ABR0S967_9HYPO
MPKALPSTPSRPSPPTAHLLADTLGLSERPHGNPTYPHKLCLVSGSFDATAGLWRWDGDAEDGQNLEREVTMASSRPDDDGSESGEKDWEFTLVLEGHDSEVKSCAFSPSGVYLATCSRDKSVWIWEDIGASEADDEWETIAVLNEHEGDVKAVAWCPDVPGRSNIGRKYYSVDVLASASYDNTVRIWREDSDAEWVCVAVLEGHEGTVWGLQWEPKPKGDRFPRLITHSADSTVRIWTLKQDEDDTDNAEGAHRSALGGIPNTMRRSLREEWTCTAVLPKVHKGDIYAVAWSAESGFVASTGADGVIALYKEEDEESEEDTSKAASSWKLLTTIPNAHGPYEVNHITWCRRYDSNCKRKGEEEMLVTTGDEGLVQPWEVRIT